MPSLVKEVKITKAKAREWGHHMPPRKTMEGFCGGGGGEEAMKEKEGISCKERGHRA